MLRLFTLCLILLATLSACGKKTPLIAPDTAADTVPETTDSEPVSKKPGFLLD